MGVARRDHLVNLFRCRVVDEIVPDFKRGGRVAAPHARCPHHTHLRCVQAIFQRGFQRLRTSQFARKGIADADSQGRRRRFAFLDHIEMRIERRDLVYLGHAHPHLFCECAQMCRRKMAVFILDQVQMFYQQIGAPRLVSQQRADLFPSAILQLTPLGMNTPPALA